MNKIKCNFCKKENVFEDEKIKGNDKMKYIYCEHCSRGVTVEFKGEKYYDTKL